MIEELDSETKKNIRSSVEPEIIFGWTKSKLRSEIISFFQGGAEFAIENSYVAKRYTYNLPRPRQDRL